jgi:hypothetical protein
MSVQLTWDTFSTFEKHVDCDTLVTTVTIPMSILAPAIPAIAAETITVTVPTEILVWEEYKLPDVTQFVEYRDLKSPEIIIAESDIHGVPDITFELKGNPNEPLWAQVMDTSKDDMFMVRSYVLNNYKTLGQTVKIEGDRGLADISAVS